MTKCIRFYSSNNTNCIYNLDNTFSALVKFEIYPSSVFYNK